MPAVSPMACRSRTSSGGVWSRADIVMPGLVPGIHVLLASSRLKTWMAGTSPATTIFSARIVAAQVVHCHRILPRYLTRILRPLGFMVRTALARVSNHERRQTSDACASRECGGMFGLSASSLRTQGPTTPVGRFMLRRFDEPISTVHDTDVTAWLLASAGTTREFSLKSPPPAATARPPRRSPPAPSACPN